jgi:Protein of unknown function (DUF5818)
MRNAKLLLLLSTLALLVFALGWKRPVVVAQQGQDPAAPTAQQSDDPHNPMSSDQEPEMKTFSGKIVKSGEKLVLKNNANESTYQLDDQDRAKSFEGRSVRVTGTMDTVTNTIRIARIEMESDSKP